MTTVGSDCGRAGKQGSRLNGYMETGTFLRDHLWVKFVLRFRKHNKMFPGSK